MDIKSIINPLLTQYCEEDNLNKKKILEIISESISKWEPELKYQNTLEALQKREKIGSTYIGHGVAIPHARLVGLKQAVCVTLTLKNAINFGDEETTQLADIIFGLLVPCDATEEHLEILSILSDRLKNKDYRDRLRHANNDQELYHFIITPL